MAEYDYDFATPEQKRAMQEKIDYVKRSKMRGVRITEYTQVYLCERCFSLTTDIDGHVEWHQQPPPLPEVYG